MLTHITLDLYQVGVQYLLLLYLNNKRQLRYWIHKHTTIPEVCKINSKILRTVNILPQFSLILINLGQTFHGQPIKSICDYIRLTGMVMKTRIIVF